MLHSSELSLNGGTLIFKLETAMHSSVVTYMFSMTWQTFRFGVEVLISLLLFLLLFFFLNCFGESKHKQSFKISIVTCQPLTYLFIFTIDHIIYQIFRDLLKDINIYSPWFLLFMLTNWCTVGTQTYRKQIYGQQLSHVQSL